MSRRPEKPVKRLSRRRNAAAFHGQRHAGVRHRWIRWSAERRRREYESLFASNVVLSRRPDAAATRCRRAARNASRGRSRRAVAGEPSIDEIADAVVRATVRGTEARCRPRSQLSQPTVERGRYAAQRRTRPVAQARSAPSARCIAFSKAPDRRGADESPGRQRRRAGELPGDQPGLLAQRQHVLIPAGARVLGETRRFRRSARHDSPSLPPAPDARRQHRSARPVPRPEPDR